MVTYSKVLERPRAGVRCYRRSGGQKFMIDPEEGEPIVFVKAGVPVIPLDEKFQVVTKDGECVNATHRFYRTAETIDPYHVVFDMM